jgi:DNA-binding beta-propeller fold protein YncE
MVKTRRLIGVVTLFTLIVIGVAVTGIELPVPSFAGGGSQPPVYQGVKAVSTTTVLRTGTGPLAGGELAFMAVEPGGNLFVSDAKRASVLRVDPTGRVVSQWGPSLGGEQLVEPAGVAVFGDSYYVLDRGTPRVFRLDVSGQAQAVLDLQSLGPYGLNGLAVDSSGNLYAADTGRNRVLVFSPAGQLLKQVGHSGNDLGGFTQPMMLAFAPDGAFFVADWENGRIERFDATFQGTDVWSTGFRPFGVAVDRAGRVYAPDFEHRRVEAYTPRGVSLGELGSAGSPAIDLSPKQLALAPDGQALYVLGTTGIQRLELANTAPPPQASTDLGDLVSVLALVLMLALVVLAFAYRRQRRRVALLNAPFERPVGLDAKDGAQRQDQEAQGDEQLLIANQAKGEQ